MPSAAAPYYACVAIFGGEPCLPYDVVASEIIADACVTQSARYYSNRTHGTAYSFAATTVAPHSARVWWWCCLG